MRLATLCVILATIGCDRVGASPSETVASPATPTVNVTGELIEAIRSLKSEPAKANDWGSKPSEPSGAEKAVERLAEVFAEREKRALEREEAAAVKAAEPKPEPVQAVAHADPVGDYTGVVVCVSDPAGVLAGTSDCVPCNLVPKAIERANARLPLGSHPWTVGTSRGSHFWLRKCDDPTTPVFQFYAAGKRTATKVGFGGGVEETNDILRRHPGVLKEPAKQFPEQRWTRQQAPPVQGAAYRSDEWDPGPNVDPQPDNGGGSCAQPQQSYGCGQPQQWATPWRVVPQATYSRQMTYVCRGGVCRWE